MQWQALGIAPLSIGGATGLRMNATEAVEPIEFAPKRAVAADAAPVPEKPVQTATGPLRIRGRVGDGLYWSLRAAGASPDVAAQYLAALATEIDVGEVAPGDSFDLVLGGGNLLYAGLSRAAAQPMQLVRWTAGGQAKWIDAAGFRVSSAPDAETALEILAETAPDHLSSAGHLRLEHRQASLEELGALADPPLTKDAIAGRIRRLLALADKRARDLGIPDTEAAVTPEMMVS